MKKQIKKYSKDEIIDAIFNKYLLGIKYEFKGEIILSHKYELVIRNVNEIEKYILSKPLARKIYDILKISNDLDDFYNKEKEKKIKNKYLKRFTDFNFNTIIRCDIDGSNIDEQIDKIIEIIKEYLNECKKEKEYKKIAKKISEKYFTDFIVLYSKNEKKIYQLINDNTKLDNYSIDWHGYYDEFIFKYMEIWNAINFKQKEYLGLKIYNFRVVLGDLFNIRKLEEHQIHKEYIKVINNINYIDIKDELLFYYIINRFNSDYYLDKNNKILLYFSLIELLITHKPKSGDDSIMKQLKKKIIECIKKLNMYIKTEKYDEITYKEIDLLYDYRSILIHGDFEKISGLLRKLEKLEFFIKMKNELEIEDDELKESMLIDIIRIRVLNIFSNIYKLMTYDEEYIKQIKKM